MGSIELVAGLLLLLFALVPLLWKLLRARPVWIKLLVLIAWVAAYAGVSWAYSTFIEPAPPERAVTNRPQIEHRDGYVGSETCRSCHIHHHETWHDSYHRTMTQTASPTSVMGDFEDVRLELDGVDYNLTHEGEKFFVESSGKRSEIVMTTGSHHMQVYWFDSGEGREVGQLPFVYLLDQERWIPRTAAFLRDPRIPRSDEFGRWNKACLKCHSTHSSWRPDAELKNARTVVSEFGISCEACHGPGENHVALNRNPLRRYALHLGEKRDPSIVQPQHIESGRSSQVCGQCHSTGEPNSPESFLQWRDDGYTYRPGENLFESRFVIRRHQTNRPAMIQGLIDDDRHFLDDHFWADGMVRVSGREYTGLLD
ncbi:MAG: multiheme c-type cytochrome, partial [Verrucomicrobiales bacterium]